VSLYNSLAHKDRGFNLLMLVLAVITLVTMATVMTVTLHHREAVWRRWVPFMAANPVQGERVFRDKGCAHCHSIDGAGGNSAPELPRRSPVQASLPQLVTAMWNHAPRMWEHMRAERLPYPQLDYEETAALLAYLYGASQREEPGNAEAGRKLFHAKQCSRCHAVQSQGGNVASELSSVRYADKLAWSGAMLTHAAEMESRMAKLTIAWPQFKAGELNDLATYLQQASAGAGKTTAAGTGDPEDGWQVFQRNSCLACHSVKENEGGLSPSFGPSTKLSASPVDVVALMWNRFPAMRQGIEQRRLSRFVFENRELADLIAFLQSLRYFEPAGSRHVGQTVFRSRGCSRCHGDSGEGTDEAPPLRHKGRIYNSISLAAALWSHGAKMHEHAQRMGIGWPALQESEVGDLLAFLNQPARLLKSEMGSH
jgi:cytochrome c2